MKHVTLSDFIAEVRSFQGGSTLPEALLLSEQGAVRTFYAPFEHINRGAKVVICGITPGLQQASIALSTAGKALREGQSVQSAQALAKATASFAGPMRSNLIAMLDHVGLPTLVGIRSAEELFGARRDLVHYTSALRNPVFVHGKNYSGSPAMLSNQAMRWQIDHFLAEEAGALCDAVWVPLGSKVSEALAYLARRGVLSESRILDGLPHPSGANAERIAVFLGRKSPDAVSAKTNPQTIAQGRHAVVQKIANLDAVSGQGSPSELKSGHQEQGVSQILNTRFTGMPLNEEDFCIDVWALDGNGK